MTKFNGIAMLIASSGRPVPVEWALSLPAFAYPVGMSASWFLAKGDPEKMAEGTLTRDMQRERLLERAVEIGADYAMFLDDDTISPNFAVQWLHRELAQRPDAAICGGIYCTKSSKPEPIVFKELGSGPHWEWTVGDVFECKGLGTGCMMIKTSCLKNIPQPWFKDHSEAKFGETVEFGGIQFPRAKVSGTDDLFFCQKVTDAGYRIIAHGGVLPVHVGQDGQWFMLPDDSYPCTSYNERQAHPVGS